MVNDVIQQIVDLASMNINVALIIVLLAVGFFIKHVLPVDNKYIPIILGIVAIILVVLMNIPFNPQKELITLLIEAIVSTFFASIIQSKGKDIMEGLKLVTGPGDSENDTEDASD